MSTTRTLFGALGIVAVLLLAGACSSGSGGASANFCNQIKKYQGEDFNSNNADEAIKAVQDVADAAPDEVKDDIDTLLDGMKKLAKVQKEAPQDPSKYKDLASDFDSGGKYTKAADHLDAYTEEHCDISTS